MNEPAKNTLNAWSSLLDELKLHEGIRSDSQLAQLLGVTPGYICSVRKGRKGLSLKHTEVIMSRLGRAFDTENLERLFVPAKVLSRSRDLSLLRRQVIALAQGHCQLCGAVAPFQGSDGIPYLEIHNIIPISNGGTTEIGNLVALCPNCHRKIEYAPTDGDVKRLQRIAKKHQ